MALPKVALPWLHLRSSAFEDALSRLSLRSSELPDHLHRRSYRIPTLGQRWDTWSA